MQVIDQERLLFRRQYLYAPGISYDDSWNHLHLPGGYVLSVHPDLKISESRSDRLHMVLLGFILDPENPGKNDQEILDTLCTASDLNALFAALEDKGGRFVLFVYGFDHPVVLNDACGLRQIFYHRDSQHQIWLSSQPALIAQHLTIGYSEEAEAYIHSDSYQSKLEPWWPGISSAFEGIYHLLPNHYFDLETSEITRFWPRKKLKKISLRKGTDLSSHLIKGIMESAHNRFPLALSLTAGFDSRVLLAASKDFAGDLRVFTMQYRRLTEKHDDIAIPKSMAAELGFSHETVVCPTEVTADFERIYQINNQGYKTDWMNIVQGRFENIPSDTVIIKGSAASIMRCSYWPDGVYPFRVTLRTLIGVSGLGKSPLVVKYFRRWMEEALVCEKYGYKLLDVFAWENEAGNWQGMSHSIFDLAHDEYCPFCNRKLIEIMLGVNPGYRCLPDVILEQKMIQTLWSELSCFPFHSSWSQGKKKRFYDGNFLNILRWVKYFFARNKYGRLEE